VSSATQAVLFNGLPLLLLAAVYAVLTAELGPALWRERERATAVDWALACLFPGIAVAALLYGVLVVAERHGIGGHVWVGLAATLVLFAPAVVLLALGRQGFRAALADLRTRGAEDRDALRDRELAALAELSHALVDARTAHDAARAVVPCVADLIGVGFAGVVLVDGDRREATGLYAELDGVRSSFWESVRLDLAHEPSGIASAVFDAAPVTVYDVAGSALVSPRLAAMVGAQSGAWVPMVAEGVVLGVLVLAATDAKRSFASDELALLQSVAGDAALALDRLRSAEALSDALGREQRIAEIVREIRAELDPAQIIRVAGRELRNALHLEVVEVRVEESVATVAFERDTPLAPGEEFLLETVSHELTSALRTADLLEENRLRLRQQEALFHAAQVVSSELELDAVLRRLVEEVTKLLGADAADCSLLDRERGVLRCAAVHGLDESVVGFEFRPERALLEGRPTVAEVPPQPAYHGFARTVVAPMAWAGETLGALTVASLEGAPSFSEAEVELIETFASLASLALRNAEMFAERSRQARIQRGFYRIAELLGEPVSLQHTYDAAAQAAAESLGGEVAAVVTGPPRRLAVVGGFGLSDAVRGLELPPALDAAGSDGRILAASDLATDERFPAPWRDAGFASLLAIPVGGELPGLVLVLFREPRPFARDDLELAQQVASAARGALDRSRLFEAERTARSLSQQLARTGSLLATELDPIAVVDAVVTEAVALVRADAATVASFDDGELVVVAAAGEHGDEVLDARSPATGWLAGIVLQSRSPVAYEDVSVDPSLADAEPLLAGGQGAYLGVPVVGPEGALFGVLSVYANAPRAWREEEIQALVALAANASVALSNAELYQRVALEREQSVAILANIGDGIVAVDRDGLVVLWNRAAEEITGVPASEAVGRAPVQVIQQELESEDGGGATRLRSIRRGSVDVWLALSETVMRDPSGGVAGRIFAFRDISAERFVEQMKTDFVSTVSVELRAPLTSIYGFSQTLLRDDVSFGEDERQTFLAFIARESERLTTIVDALLNASRLESGDLAVALEPTDVAAVLVEVVDDAGATGNGHRIVADVNGEDVTAQADPEKLRHVLEQLVSNAVKYSPNGGTVVVSARRLADGVELSVLDEGVGIPAAERERIFEKFYKAGGGRGTGLGLFIAQGLVREMGGRMRVASEEGKGSRFSFELPPAGAV
jgi:PAS domain S-box-containing protein